MSKPLVRLCFLVSFLAVALLAAPLQASVSSVGAGSPTIVPMAEQAAQDDDGSSSLPTSTPSAVVEGQSAAELIIHGEDSRADEEDGRSPSDDHESASGGGCELVEVYPGYPGFRGYVTGVAGVGDHACLEDLEAMDPDFDRDYEDEQNLDAAERLGINGGPDDWTWENWLAIEAERGLPVTCYVCAMADADSRQEPRNHNVERDDPRLLLGPVGSNSLFYLITDDLGINSPYPMENYELRAMAHMVSSDPYPNAPELLNLAYELVEDLNRSGGGVPSVRCTFMEQGSYSPLPPEAHPADQEFQFYVAGAIVVNYELGPMMANSLSMQIENFPDRWYADVVHRGDDMTLGEYWYQEVGSGYCG